MPKYKVSFEYETEVEADNEEDAIFNCSTVICEYMGDNAIVEEIEQFVKEPTNKKGVSDE
jgi:NADH:ubiquinone oxidoreductase subunit E